MSYKLPFSQRRCKSILSLIKQWEAEHKSLCSYIKAKQHGISDNAKREEHDTTLEADTLKGCINSLLRAVHGE